MPPRPSTTPATRYAAAPARLPACCRRTALPGPWGGPPRDPAAPCTWQLHAQPATCCSGYGPDLLPLDRRRSRDLHEDRQRRQEVLGRASVCPAQRPQLPETLPEHPVAGPAPGLLPPEPARGDDDPLQSPHLHPNTGPILRPFQHHQPPHIRHAHRMGGRHALPPQPSLGALFPRLGGLHLLLLHRVLHVLQEHRHQHGQPPVRCCRHTQQGMLHARPRQTPRCAGRPPRPRVCGAPAGHPVPLRAAPPGMADARWAPCPC